jgi:hypothetical protein
MRAHTKGKHEIRKRFAIVIGVAAVGVMALGAQTAAQTQAPTPPAPAVVEYDTTLVITTDAGVMYHGWLFSDRTECTDRRKVILFEKLRGADRRLATTRSNLSGDPPVGWWPAGWVEGERGREMIKGPDPGHGRVYAKVKRAERAGYVCRGDRTPIYDGHPREAGGPLPG